MRTETGRFVIGETCIDATVEEGFLRYVGDLVAEARRGIELKIGLDPFFGTTYYPMEPSEEDVDIVRSMCSASVLAGVGPMAAVAGAVARYVAHRLRELGCRHIVLDNGGDICISSETKVVVGVLVGAGPDLVMLNIGPTEMAGVCSSSGKMGHSLSLGSADVCTVVAEDPALADACATALCNVVAEEPGKAVENICLIPGVSGCLAVVGGILTVCGDVGIVPNQVLDG